MRATLGRIRQVTADGQIQSVRKLPLVAPAGVAVAPDGSVLIADMSADVLRLSPTKVVRHVNALAQQPTGIAVTPSGTLVVAHMARDRVTSVPLS